MRKAAIISLLLAAMLFGVSFFVYKPPLEGTRSARDYYAHFTNKPKPQGEYWWISYMALLPLTFSAACFLEMYFDPTTKRSARGKGIWH